MEAGGVVSRRALVDLPTEYLLAELQRMENAMHHLVRSNAELVAEADALRASSQSSSTLAAAAAAAASAAAVDSASAASVERVSGAESRAAASSDDAESDVRFLMQVVSENIVVLTRQVAHMDLLIDVLGEHLGDDAVRAHPVVASAAETMQHVRAFVQTDEAPAANDARIDADGGVFL